MTRWIAFLCSPLFGLLLGTFVGAQTMYKSTMPDGSIVFSDKPPPGASKVETIKVEPSQPAAKAEPSKGDKSKAADKKAPAVDPAALQKLREEKAKRERAEANVAAAEKALRTAEEALAKGEEPLPGERTGIVGGKTRLNEAYWARQRKLKDDVENARANLERARTQLR
jgi:hypothetical protein